MVPGKGGACVFSRGETGPPWLEWVSLMETRLSSRAGVMKAIHLLTSDLTFSVPALWSTVGSVTQPLVTLQLASFDLLFRPHVDHSALLNDRIKASVIKGAPSWWVN